MMLFGVALLILGVLPAVAAVGAMLRRREAPGGHPGLEKAGKRPFRPPAVRRRACTSCRALTDPGTMWEHGRGPDGPVLLCDPCHRLMEGKR